MESVIHDPWSVENNERVMVWIKTGRADNIIGAEFSYEDILGLIDHAETEDMLGELSREEAILLLGLWLGRFQGARENGGWPPK